MRKEPFLSSAIIILLAAGMASLTAGEISGPLVVSDAWPQCTDLKTWADDVIRIEGKGAASDRDKAITLYYWTRLFAMGPRNGAEPYEGPYGAETWQFDRHKVFFVWGGGDCGFLSAAHEAVWTHYNNDNDMARKIYHPAAGHVMCEYKWDGAWHAFDPLSGVFFLASDSPTANVLSFAQLAGEDQLLRDNEFYTNRCRPFFDRVRSWDSSSERKDLIDITGVADSYADWEAAGSDPHMVYATSGSPVGTTWWDMNWKLPQGMKIERQWDSGAVFYVPQVNALRYGLQGRHFRQATDWGTDTTNWNAIEDIFNFPKVASYLKVCTDATETYFYNNTTLFLMATGTQSYEADLWSDAWDDAVDGSTTMVRADTAPYVRPAGTGPENIIFRIRSPFILANGRLRARIICGAGNTATFHLSTNDGGAWEQIASGSGSIDINIGQARFNGAQHSVTGNYEFLLKFTADAASDPAGVGLASLNIDTVFDSSIHTLPRIVDGANTVRMKVADQTDLTAPLEIVYNWETGAGAQSDTRLLNPGDFSANEASYAFDASGLTRCNSYSVDYAPRDTDNDGMNDAWETLLFGDLDEANDGDADGDGLNNTLEFDAGTDP
ncbi:hypothetical protein ACFL4W_01595, partial [Planctomycetota bacterium]